jgi:hypothetical protein
VKITVVMSGEPRTGSRTGAGIRETGLTCWMPVFAGVWVVYREII